jgi:hypothetical protein
MGYELPCILGAPNGNDESKKHRENLMDFFFKT